MFDDVNRWFESGDRVSREQQVDGLMQSGQLTEALALLEYWRDQEPWNGEVLVRMAVVHWMAGEPARTLRDLDAFLRMDPENAEVLARRAQALLMLGKRNDAEATLARAEALDPRTPGVLLNRALLLEAGGHYDEAITALDAYLQQMPQDHLTLARRSQLHRQVGHYARALADAEACVQLSPDDPEAHFAEALARVTLEQGDAALAACDTCLRLRADFLPALRLRIDLLADLNRLPEAEQSLLALQQADPGGPHTALLQARVAAERGQFEPALAWVNRFLDDNPDEAYGYFRRGMIYFQMEQYEAALADFTEYHRLAPRALEAYEQQFMCYLGLERYAEASRIGHEAVALLPESCRLRYNAAFADLLCGEAARARDGFHAAIALEPDNEEMLLRIHLALREYGGPMLLRGWLREALAAMPAASPLLKGLYAETRLDDGHAAEALALAEEVRDQDATRPFAYLLGVKALCLLDRYPEALACARQGVAVLPDDGRLRMALALVLRDTGQPSEALRELDVAARLMPDAVEVLRQRALVFGSTGEVEQAITLLQHAVARDASSPDSYFWLGYFLLHVGQFQEALEAALAMLRIEDAVEGELLRGAALRGLGRHDEADAAFARVRRDDPALLARMASDPLIAALLSPVPRGGLVDRLRRSMRQGWQLLWQTVHPSW